MKKLIPIVIIILFTAAGFATGNFLKPPQTPVEDTAEGAADPGSEGEVVPEAPQKKAAPQGPMDYVKLNNQFVVPIVTGDRVSSVIVMSLSVEAPEGKQEEILRREAKLRDSFLQVLFDHASLGGFNGEFTALTNLSRVRQALRERAQMDLGPETVNDILITDIARQDY